MCKMKGLWSNITLSTWQDLNLVKLYKKPPFLYVNKTQRKAKPVTTYKEISQGLTLHTKRGHLTVCSQTTHTKIKTKFYMNFKYYFNKVSKLFSENSKLLSLLLQKLLVFHKSCFDHVLPRPHSPRSSSSTHPVLCPLFVLTPTKFNLCCQHVLGCVAIHWSRLTLPEATFIEKLTLPLPESIHPWPLANWDCAPVSSPCWVRVWPAFVPVLCVCDNCCEFKCAAAYCV